MRLQELDVLLPELSFGFVQRMMEEKSLDRIPMLNRLVPKLLQLHNGHEAAFAMFLRVYYDKARRALFDDIRGYGFQFSSDELLLSICRACPSDFDLSLWRKALSTKQFRRRIGCTPARSLPRSMQYIYETHAQPMFAMVVTKVARYKLPHELQDTIYHQLLVDRNIYVTSDKNTLWKAYDGADLRSKSQTAYRGPRCCGFADSSQSIEYRDQTERLNGFATRVLRWSRLKHEYISYHVDPWAPETLLVQTKSDHSAPRERHRYSLVYRKCPRQIWEPLADSTKFAVGFYPFRGHELYEFFFEIDSECEWSHELGEIEDEIPPEYYEEDDHGSDLDMDGDDSDF